MQERIEAIKNTRYPYILKNPCRLEDISKNCQQGNVSGEEIKEDTFNKRFSIISFILMNLFFISFVIISTICLMNGQLNDLYWAIGNMGVFMLSTMTTVTKH